jgi:glyoxylase-like metal-dependent hydrolase (beta-lactamase superfamily II)
MRIGDIEIVALQDGEAKVSPTDAYAGTTDSDWAPHRRWLTHDGLLDIPIGCFLIRTGDRRVLVDAGLGPYSGNGFTGGRLLDELGAHGVRPRDITDVVLTHLHFDHVGWTTQKGSIVFPAATYRCHTGDWRHFVEGGDAARKLRPVEGRLETWDGATTLAPGLDTLPTPGHTPGHTALIVSSGDERAMLLGDATHCPVELDESEWDGMGDVDPALARRTREALFRELESTGTPAAAAHFPGLAFGRVLRAGGRRGWVIG